MILVTDYMERLEIRLLESTIGQKALAWYRRLPDREQSLFNLLAMSSLSILLIASLALPSSRFVLNAVSAYEQAREDITWMRAHEDSAQKIAAAESRPMDPNGMVTTAVSSAKAFDLKFRRYEPTADGDLRIWLEEVSFGQVVTWLQDLSNRHQLQVDTLTITPSAQAGQVDVRLEIKG